MTKHIWHKEIKAWADGAEIEFKDGYAWWDAGDPEWNEDGEYRIKPQPKKEWVSLSYEEADGLILQHQHAPFKLVRAIEQSLKEKNYDW